MKISIQQVKFSHQIFNCFCIPGGSIDAHEDLRLQVDGQERFPMVIENVLVVYEMGFDARRKDASWLTSLDHLTSLDSLTSFTTLLSHSLYSTSLRFAPFRSWLPRANVKSHFIHYLPHPPYTLQVNIKSPFLYY